MADMSGPRLKLSRAREHLKFLKAMVSDFAKSEPHAFVMYPQERPGERFVGAKLKKNLPKTFGIVLGELLHNARSALDHVVYQISALADGDTKRGRLMFPIFTCPTKYGESKGRRLCGVSKEHCLIIDGLQPCNRDGVNDPLCLLHDLNNTDKHRIIPVCIASSKFSSVMDFESVGAVSVEFLDNVMTTDDYVPIMRVTGEACTGAQMKFKLGTNVQFGESEPWIEGREVFGALLLICDKAEEIIGEFDS